MNTYMFTSLLKIDVTIKTEKRSNHNVQMSLKQCLLKKPYNNKKTDFEF